MVWGDAVNMTDICMDFEPCFKVYNFVDSAYPKTIKLGLMTTFATLNVIFHVVLSI